MNTWDFLSDNNKKAKQQEKKPTNKLQVGSGGMNELSSNWTFLSAVNMCSLGNKNQLSPAEVQLIWVPRKGNIYQRHWRKHSDAECYGFITEEETIQSYKTTQCTSLLMIHKINIMHLTHSGSSNMTFFPVGFGWFFQGKQYSLLTRGGENHALQ